MGTSLPETLYPIALRLSTLGFEVGHHVAKQVDRIRDARHFQFVEQAKFHLALPCSTGNRLSS